jgi:hypothetical protein
VTWREPALLVDGGTLYLAAQCGKANGAFAYIGVFAATIGMGNLSTWDWTYLGPLFKPSDPAQLLPNAGLPAFTEIDLTKKADGGLMAIFSLLDEAAGTGGNGQKYGSATVDVVSLGTVSPKTPPVIARDCSGKLMPTGRVMASDQDADGGAGPGASTYEAAQSSVGVLIARRAVIAKSNAVNGFVFDTGLFPQ